MVIVGLLIGGVLSGKEIIRAAQRQKIMADMAEIPKNIFTFQSKYNCIPGDCKRAAAYFPSTTNGNGDGRITAHVNYNDHSTPTYTVYEVGLYFQHLAMAHLMNTDPSTDPTCYDDVPYGLQVIQVGGNPSVPLWHDCNFPLSAMGVPVAPVNAITLGIMPDNTNLICINADPYCHFPYPDSQDLGPIDQALIDKKLDDGLPLNGKMMSTCSESGSYTSFEEGLGEYTGVDRTEEYYTGDIYENCFSFMRY